MTWRGPELVIDAAFAYIEANQRTKLDAVVARDWTHDLAMPDFAAMRLMDPRGIEGEAVFPILLAIPLEDEPVRVMGGGPVTMATHRVLWVVIATHPGTVGATGAYALLPAEASKRLAIRYMIAVREMLLELHSHASDRPYHWTPGKPRYGDTYATQAGEWVSDSQLEATIEHKE